MFQVKRNSKGFTLIEMLVVIAIIAILVAIIIPTVNSAANKAKAATDASNLRSVLSVLNIIVMDHNGHLEQADLASMTIPASKVFPTAHVEVEFCMSHYIRIFYVVGTDAYYGLEYFSSMAENGTADESISTEKPATTPDITWLTTVTSNG